MQSDLHQIALGAADLERSTRFYRDVLQLRWIAGFDPPGLVFFDLAGTRLLLERSAEVNPGDSVLYLRVEGIEREHARLAGEDVSFSSPPTLVHTDVDGTFGVAGTEEWMAFFCDPDGNQLALVESRLPAERSTS